MSFGALVAIRFAATRATSTSALVLVSAPGPGWRLRPRHELYAQLPWMKVTGSQPLSVNLDGEGLEAQVCDYRARRADLLVHVHHLPGEEPGVDFAR